MSAGLLIAFEGIDGAGTSSQVQAVGARLRKEGYGVTTTHEPSSGAIGTFTRAELATATAEATQGNTAALGLHKPAGEAAMALLFAADRLHHLEHCVAPARSRGQIILCDRYVWSSYAYQASVLGPDWVRAINSLAPVAEATVYLSVPLAVARARRVARGGRVERFDTDARQALAAEHYDALARSEPSCHTIDATGTMAEVTGAICRALAPLLAGHPRLPRPPTAGG